MRWFVAVLALLMLTAGGCDTSGTSVSSGTNLTTTTSAVPQPAGATPSESAKMICSTEARKDIDASLGVDVLGITSPTWVDHAYACRYRYPDGVISMTVKELDDAAGTQRYYGALGALLGRQPDAISFGQGAFITTDGSVVVKKDWKVLLVDASGLPAQFGPSRLAHSDVAVSIAAAIMGCWTGV